MAKQTKSEELNIIKLSRSRVVFHLMGVTPLVYNAMTNKIAQQLLLPPKKKTAGDKATTLKHRPVEEFRDSMYYSNNPDGATRLMVPATMIKAAMMGAARDIPGAARTTVGRLVYIEGSEIEVYGVPELMMNVVRMADIKRTPDVRTRAVLPRWAAKVAVTFTTPILSLSSVANLVAAAGLTHGIGDWRIEKGSGTFGGFELVDEGDPAFEEIVATMGRAAQDAAIESPVAFDGETESLLAWYDAEVQQRGFKVVTGGKP